MSTEIKQWDPDTISEEERQFALWRAIEGLREDDPVSSASVPVVRWQRWTLWSLLALVVGCAIWQPGSTAVVLVGISTVGYLLTMADRLLIFRDGLAARAIVIPDEKALGICDADLPPYTILVPAYNEPEVVGELIGAMAALQYPADKLQVLLLLEADDDITIGAARNSAESEAINILDR